MKQKIQWAVGALLVAVVLSLTLTVAGRTAISELSGLAVAQSSTVWKNVRDASVGDNLADGILAIGLMLFDGTNFDRARGDVANGLDVDVTRITGTITPADAYANPTTANQMWSLNGVFNGTTWDRWRGQSSPVEGPGKVNVTAVSAANTALTVTIAGVAATRIHLYRLNHVACSPDGASKIQITDGGVLAYDSYAGSVPTAPMSYTEVWPVGLTGGVANSMVITVNACGAGNVSLLTYEVDQF